MAKRKRRGNGEGSISQRPDGLWVGRISLGYDANGKRKRRAVYGQTKREVQEKLTRLQNKALDGTLGDATKETVAAFLERWLEDNARVEVRGSTLDSYRGLVNTHVAPRIGGVKLAALSPAHVDGMLSEMEKAGVSARRREMVHTVLHRALETAVGRGLVARNVCKIAKAPTVPQNEMQYLAADEADRFLQAAEADRLHAMYVLAITTGMRQGELFALHWEDIDLEAGELSVRRTVTVSGGKPRIGPPKTKKSRRRIKLSGMAVEALQERRKLALSEGLAGCELVFPSREGTLLHKTNVTRRSLRPILRRAELATIRFHDLRHTAATLMLFRGVNIKVVSEMLGHAKVSITLDIYSHVLPTMQETAAEAMDGLFGSNGHKVGIVG